MKLARTVGEQPLLRFFSYLLVIASSGWAPLMAHDFHASVGSMELNREAGTLEVILRVFTNDLERAVARDSGQADFRLDGKNEAPVAHFLAKHFQVVNQAKQALPQNWIGLEWTVKETWLYVEIKLPAEPSGLDLRYSLFLEWFGDQINTINLKGAHRHTLVFNKDRPVLPIPDSWLKP